MTLSIPPEAAPPAPVIGASAISPINLRLIERESQVECNFWIGLVASGLLTPAELMQEQDVGALLHQAASQGVLDQPPILLADSSRVPPRYVYLLAPPTAEFRERAAWTSELTRNLGTWAPKRLGLYLAPELSRMHDVLELVSLSVRALVTSGVVHEVLLLIGAYGVNPLLNTALRLKSELEADGLVLHVYH